MAEIRSFSFGDEAPNIGGFNDITLAPEDIQDEAPALAGKDEAEEDAPRENIEGDQVHPDNQGQPDNENFAGSAPEADPGPDPGDSEVQQTRGQPDEQSNQKEGVPQPDEQIKLLIAKQQAQIDYLTGLLSSQQPGNVEGNITQPSTPTADDINITEEEVIADPVGAIRKAVDAKIAAFRKEQQAQQTQHQQSTELKAQQEQSWSVLQERLPAFQNEHVQQMWANVFYNPANGYLDDPAGPIRAGNHVANMLRGMGMAPPNDTQKQVAPAPTAESADIKTVEANAAAAERARQARVKKSAMHGGGKGGNRQKVSGLKPQHLQYAKEFGLDPSAIEKVIAGRNG